MPFRLLAALAIALLFNQLSVAQSGFPDLSFGQDGRLITNIFPSDDQGFAVLVRPDGRIVAVGRATVDSVNQFAVVQYLSYGRPDTAFNYDGKMQAVRQPDQPAIAYASALYSDGRLMVAGFTGTEGNEDFALLRLTPDGFPDTSFQGSGWVTTDFAGTDFAYAVLQQPDDKIIAAGYTSPDGFEADFALARYLPSGALDTTFGDNGRVVQSFSPTSDVIFDAVLQPDGYIVVAGQVYDDFFGSDFIVARYRPDGHLDSTFGLNGVATRDFTSDDLGRGVALQSDGKIIVAGISSVDFIPKISVARFQANGWPDSTFGNNGQLLLEAGALGNFCTDVLVQPDGRILLSGMVEVGDFRDFFVLRRLPDGSPDLGFGIAGGNVTAISAGDDNSYRLALREDGGILLLGASSAGTHGDFALASYLPNGIPDTLFAFPTLGAARTDLGSSTDDLNALLVHFQGDSTRILAGGTAYAGAPESAQHHLAVARYDLDGRLDTSFATNGILNHWSGETACTDLIRQPDNQVVAAGRMNGQAGLLRFDELTGLPDANFGNGGTAPSNFAANSIFNALVLRADGRIVAGGQSPEPGEKDLLVQYLANGAYDLDFGNNGQAQTLPGLLGWDRLALDADEKMLALGSRDLNGVTERVLVRFLANGAVDASFGDNGLVAGAGLAGQQVHNLLVLVSGKILVAGGDPDFSIARLLPNGLPDPTFGVAGRFDYDFDQWSNELHALAEQPDGKIIVAGRNWDATTGAEVNGFAISRLHADGGLDEGFGFPAGHLNLPGEGAYRLVQDEVGNTFIGGTTQNGFDRDFLLMRVYAGPNVSQVDDANDSQIVNLYPNPVRETLQLDYELSASQQLSIQLFDDAGRQVTTLLSGATRPPGAHQETLRLPVGLPSGYYTVVFSTQNGPSKALKIIVY